MKQTGLAEFDNALSAWISSHFVYGKAWHKHYVETIASALGIQFAEELPESMQALWERIKRMYRRSDNPFSGVGVLSEELAELLNYREIQAARSALADIRRAERLRLLRELYGEVEPVPTEQIEAKLDHSLKIICDEWF